MKAPPRSLNAGWIADWCCNFAAELAKENVPLNLIQKQLGHSSVATTSQYLDHIAPRQVIEAMRSRRWAGEPK